MQKVKIIADSASDIRPEIVEKLNITIVPLKVRFGDKEFRDFYDLPSDEFFKLMKSTDVMPKTSMVSPALWEEAFRKELEEYESLICITMSSEVSGTYNSAVIAKEKIGNENIEIIDSRNLSFACGFTVMEAAKMAIECKGKNEIVKYAKDLIKRIQIYFIVDSLEYLRKGGRINFTQAVFGTVFDIKPLLTVEDGLIVPFAKIRGKKNIISKIVKILKEKREGYCKSMAFEHGLVPELKEELKEKIIETFKPEEIIETKVGCVIGSHTGPGVVGVIFVQND